MLKIFQSATIKLTGWYLLILMITTSLFSVIIYRMSTLEISGRLESLELRLEDDPAWPLYAEGLHDARMRQEAQAQQAIFFSLFYTNVAIWILGGLGSYWLARRTLQPIQDMHEAQTRFTSDASHELKTPLAVMKSELELALRDGSMKKADYKEIISSSLEEVNKLTDLTHGLLQMSRLEYGSINLDEPVDIASELQHVVKLLDTDNRVALDPPQKPIQQQGNSSMLRDLFMIVIDNALRYSPSDSSVTITLSGGSKTTIRVTNQGEAISDEDLDRLFDRFYRVDHSRTIHSGIKSYGIGLSVARKIVELHQGDISISSSAKKGTTVQIVLPKL